MLLLPLLPPTPVPPVMHPVPVPLSPGGDRPGESSPGPLLPCRWWTEAPSFSDSSIPALYRMSLFWLLQLLVVPFFTTVPHVPLLGVPEGGWQPNVLVLFCLLPPVELLGWPELHLLPLLAVPHLYLLPSPPYNLHPMHLLCCERLGVIWRQT